MVQGDRGATNAYDTDKQLCNHTDQARRHPPALPPHPCLTAPTPHPARPAPRTPHPPRTHNVTLTTLLTRASLVCLLILSQSLEARPTCLYPPTY